MKEYLPAPPPSLCSDCHLEAQFLLPRAAASHFATLFRALDELQEQENAAGAAGASYGLAQTSLEEVFLALADDTDEKPEEAEAGELAGDEVASRALAVQVDSGKVAVPVRYVDKHRARAGDVPACLTARPSQPAGMRRQCGMLSRLWGAMPSLTSCLATR
jgi:hypothetical protein